MSENLALVASDKLSREEIVIQAVGIVDLARNRGLTVRIMGGLACWIHSSKTHTALSAQNRTFSDVDFVALFHERNDLDRLLNDYGFCQDARTARIPGLRRSLYVGSPYGWTADIVYDRLEFCHVIDLRERFEHDYPTIPLADLLLHKLQILELNWKDVFDVQILLLEHGIGNSDKETINVSRVMDLCGRDWGLWKTTKMNLEKIAAMTRADQRLEEISKKTILDRTIELQQAVDACTKTIHWKLRSLLGDTVCWYKRVEEI